MSSSIKLTNSSGKIVTITNPDTTSADVAVDLLNNAYTIATVDDFGTVPVGYTTVIVKDTDRGGTFIWSSTGTANGGTVFAGSSGYWVRQYSGAVNVRWFGAKGDGITDDTVAIQNAVNVGSSVYFPASILGSTSEYAYIINSTIIVSNRARIFSDSLAKTSSPVAIKAGDSLGSNAMFDIQTTSFEADNIAFYGQSFRAETSTCLYFRSNDDVRLTGLWFTGFAKCVTSDGVMQGYHILNCTFDVNLSAITVETATPTFANNVISNCRFHRNKTSIKVVTDDVSKNIGNIITNNVFDYGMYGYSITSTDASIYFDYSMLNIVSNNTFNNSARDIYINNSSDTLVSKNTFFKGNRNAITLKNSSSVEINGNIFYSYNQDNVATANEDCVIYMDTTGTGIILANNIFSDDGTPTANYAVYFVGSTQVSHEDNNVYNITSTNDKANVLSQIMNPTLLNSWVIASEGLRIYKKNGTVFINGTIQAGTTTDGTIIYNLPSGYRPSQQTRHVVISADAFAKIYIANTGNIQIYGCGYWISLNLMFKV